MGFENKFQIIINNYNNLLDLKSTQKTILLYKSKEYHHDPKNDNMQISIWFFKSFIMHGML